MAWAKVVHSYVLFCFNFLIHDRKGLVRSKTIDGSLFPLGGQILELERGPGELAANCFSHPPLTVGVRRVR